MLDVAIRTYHAATLYCFLVRWTYELYTHYSYRSREKVPLTKCGRPGSRETVPFNPIPYLAGLPSPELPVAGPSPGTEAALAAGQARDEVPATGGTNIVVAAAFLCHHNGQKTA